MLLDLYGNAQAANSGVIRSRHCNQQILAGRMVTFVSRVILAVLWRAMLECKEQIEDNGDFACMLLIFPVIYLCFAMRLFHSSTPLLVLLSPSGLVRAGP